MDGDVAQVEECLCSKYEALSSDPSTPKKTKIKYFLNDYLIF
jgi:hypothetical protein